MTCTADSANTYKDTASALPWHVLSRETADTFVTASSPGSAVMPNVFQKKLRTRGVKRHSQGHSSHGSHG